MDSKGPFETVISLDSTRLKLPKAFYRDNHQRFPAQLWVETEAGLPYAATVVVERGIPYLDTDTASIMQVLGADGFAGTAPSRRALLTYFSSIGVFKIHCPMSGERLRPRVMRGQPAPLEVVPPINELGPNNEQNPAAGDTPDDPIEL